MDQRGAETKELDLRSIFIALDEAVAASDVARVEAATAELMRFVRAPGPVLDPAALLDLDSMSARVADRLASRLRAYDHAITAWRKAETHA